MPNPFRLTVRWITTDAFPNARVVLGNDPPRWDFGLTSSWPIPNVQTSEDLAVEIDHLREGIKFAYTADQLRFLAVQVRKTKVAIASAREYPWYSGGIDPYGDPAAMFQCDYHGKAGTETLLLWLAEIRVEA